MQVVDAGSPRLTNLVQFAIAVVPTVTAAISNQSLDLSWRSKTNQAYRLEYSESLQQGSWITAARDITTQKAETHLSEPIGERNRFYPLVLE